MRLTIDLGAYARNLELLKARLAPSELMAVVKDDAYGHGIDGIVPAALAQGISRFAVLDIPTGLRVRALAPREVQLFAWLFDHTADFESAIEAGIDLGVSNLRVLSSIAQSGATIPARIHLKIDTGLHRNGASVQDWPALIDEAKRLQELGLIDVVGVWSHIGEASDEEDAKSRQTFEQAYDEAVGAGLNIIERHLSASAASFNRPDFRYSFSRVGGFTYGIAPGEGIGPAQLGLEAVMSARATVTEISRDAHNGALIATIDAGFVDGIPDWIVRPERLLNLPQTGFEVLVRGHRAPVLAINAQTIEIDVSRSEGVTVGDEVTIFGSHLKGAPVLQEIADAIGTVGEELVVRVGPRAQREYLAND